MEKKELRKYIRQQKALHSKDELRAMSEQICSSIIRDGMWRWAGTVLLYHALSDEVDTQMLIDHAMLMGKKVLLPVVVGDDLELRVYEGPESLREGAYGILEPTGPLFPECEYGNIDIAIVPGMAFDPYCHRLGRGKGYYDRLLSCLKRAYCIGVCFPFQKVECVPCEEHDVKMNETVCC